MSHARVLTYTITLAKGCIRSQMHQVSPRRERVGEVRTGADPARCYAVKSQVRGEVPAPVNAGGTRRRSVPATSELRRRRRGEALRKDGEASEGWGVVGWKWRGRVAGRSFRLLHAGVADKGPGATWMPNKDLMQESPTE